MNRNPLVSFLLISACLILSSAALAQQALAQEETQDEADVWEQIEAEWNAAENGDREWPEEMLTDDFSGWNKDNPVPRGKASIKMWNRFNEQLGQAVQHELYPYRIIVNGDVAVAHYFYSNVFKDKDGEFEVSNGRYTDVLVRTDDGWKFLAWHGGNED